MRPSCAINSSGRSSGTQTTPMFVRRSAALVARTRPDTADVGADEVEDDGRRRCSSARARRWLRGRGRRRRTSPLFVCRSAVLAMQTPETANGTAHEAEAADGASIRAPERRRARDNDRSLPRTGAEPPIETAEEIVCSLIFSMSIFPFSLLHDRFMY